MPTTHAPAVPLPPPSPDHEPVRVRPPWVCDNCSVLNIGRRWRCTDCGTTRD